MRFLFSSMLLVSLVGTCSGPSKEIGWLEPDVLESHLAGRAQSDVPLSLLLSEGHGLCAVGSYAFRLPPGYEAAERDLNDTTRLPVNEGVGLVVIFDDHKRVRAVTTLPVRSGPVVLSVGEPVCLPAASAHIAIRRIEETLTVTLEPST